MSLVTLKKKSRNNRRFAPISGRGTNGFSLNGGHRNIGSVGQFRMISNTTRTPYRGVAPMGNGGNNGKYYNNPLNSGSCCTNDNKIIKNSSLNTAGMIDTKYKWTKSKYPNFWVQEDDNSYRLTRDQATYISNLTKKYGSCVFTNVQSNGNCGTTVEVTNDPNTPPPVPCTGNKNVCSYYIGTKKYIRMKYAKNFNQPAMSQGQYIRTGGTQKYNPICDNKQPFPMNLHHSTRSQFNSSRIGSQAKSDAEVGFAGCQVNYLTWQDAQDDGALPSNWKPGQPDSTSSAEYRMNLP